MRPRCVELARVLKKTGSFYYHCDWHASHYVKVMLDQIFSEQNFVNEIIWKRQSSHNDAKQGSKHLGRVHDSIFLYCGGGDYYFKHLYLSYDPDYVEKFYRHVEEDTGRRYRLSDITGPGGASKGNPHYEFLGVTRYWRYNQEKMNELYNAGLILQSKPGAVPAQKRYLDEAKGVPLGSVWDDINPLHASDAERLGYPTQKPLKLLERISKLAQTPTTSSSTLSVVAALPLSRPKISVVSGLASTSPRPLAASWPSACAMSAKFVRTKTTGSTARVS